MLFNTRNAAFMTICMATCKLRCNHSPSCKNSSRDLAVGGLSLINAIAGAYSEDLPVICIVGGPNSNDYGTNRILHHTIGISDFNQVCCSLCKKSSFQCTARGSCRRWLIRLAEHVFRVADSACAAVTQSLFQCDLPSGKSSPVLASLWQAASKLTRCRASLTSI